MPAERASHDRDGERDRRPLFLGVFALIALAIVAAVLIGRSGGDGDKKDTSTASKGGCEIVDKPDPKQVALKAPPQTVKPGQPLTAVVDTSCGTFEIKLDTTRAPKTSNSFAYLADKGIYDGLLIHRIAQGPNGPFAIQGGDPLGSGLGGVGYSVDEAPPQNLSYTKGIVAMAKSGADPPGRSGSQFFVVSNADAGLPPDYALLGKVSSGQDVVTRISKIPVDAMEAPKQTVLINKVTIEDR